MAEERKYNHLSQNFFRGSAKGQINSVYKDRETKPEKLEEYKKALADNDTNLGTTLTKQLATKLVNMGIEIPAGVEVKSAARTTAEPEAQGSEQQAAE